MKHIRQKLFSQNFLYNSSLIARLINQSNITHYDLVIEIGPGAGIITHELIKHASHVVAIEIDTYWIKHLRQKYNLTANLTLHHQDFLQFNLPKLPYKVFANIPFAIEGRIIRRLLESTNPPFDCHLVVMDKLAQRLTDTHKPSLFSALHRPWFDFAISHRFQITDFRPTPSVKAVLLRFRQKPTPLLSLRHKLDYQQFVRHGYTNGRPVYHNLKTKYPSVSQVFHQLSLSRSTKPSQLSHTQWIDLFQLTSELDIFPERTDE